MEKNCQKRRQPPVTDSVIARLMGLDELPHQRPFHKYQRVLSDSYICKSASIGLRRGSSVPIGRSRDTNNEMLQGVSGASGLQIYKDKNLFVHDKYTHKSTGTGEMVDRNLKPAVVSLSKSTSGASHEDRKAFVGNSEHRSPGNVLRYLQKLDNDSSTNQLHGICTGYANDFFTVHSDRTGKHCLSSTRVSNFKLKFEKSTDYCGVTKRDRLSRSQNGESPSPESGNHCDLRNELVDSDIESPRYNFIGSDRTMNRTSRQQRHRTIAQDLSGQASTGRNYRRNESQVSLPSRSGVYCYDYYNNCPSLLAYKSYSGQEILKKNFERQKIEKENEKIQVSGRGQTHVKMEAFATVETTPKYLNLRLGRNGLCAQYDSESVTIKESLSTRSGGKIEQKLEILKNRCDSGFEQLSSPDINSSTSQSGTSVEESGCYLFRKGSENNSPDAYAETNEDEMEDSSEDDRCREIDFGSGVSGSSKSFQCRINDALADIEASSRGVFSKISRDQQPESNKDFFSSKDVSSSYSQEASSVEEQLLNEFSDEGSGYANYSGLCLPEDQTKQLKGLIHQHSPDSVLESFDKQYPSLFECSENIGQQRQCQGFNSESEEAYSEGSEMVVSGNEEEKEEGIGDLSYSSGKVHRWLGDGESRNFCYLIDVLDEAGYFKERSMMDIIKSWDCLELPINPLVFEALEKKYGRQTCWQKSVRQLLFDLINSGLTAIITRLVNFHSHTTSLRRRFMAGINRDEVEDELWKMMMSLESGKSRDASEKVVEGATKWWEADDEDINSICRELEVSLFEELVMESINLWNE